MVLSGLRSGEVYGPGGVRKRWIEPTSGNTGKGLAEIAKLLGIEFTAVFSRLGVSQRIKTDLASNGARTITIGNEYTFADLESLGRKYKKPIHYYWSMPEPLGTKLQSFIRSQVMEVRRQIYSATPEEAAPDLHLTSIDQDYLTARVLPAAKEASISPIIMKTGSELLQGIKNTAVGRIPELKDPEIIVAFLCPRGNTSMSLNTLFSQLGYENVCSIKGGLEGRRTQSQESSEFCPIPGSTISKSSIDYVKRLVQDHQNEYYTFMQYENIQNVNVHAMTTGPELQNQVGNDMNVVICTFGTGGTATGLATYFKETGVKIWAAFPERPIEGIRTINGAEGLAFFKPELYDKTIEVNNSKANELWSYCVEKGIAIGPSTAIGLQAAIDAQQGMSFVTIAADGIENYETEYRNLSTFRP
jgi:cysteine synthase A